MPELMAAPHPTWCFARLAAPLMLLGAFAAFGSEGHSAEPAGTIRILSYNIHHGAGMDGRVDLERIAEVIRAVEPDIVALQEVDQTVERSGRVDQAAELAERCGMQHVFGSNLDLQGGKYGNAILTRLEVLESKNHALPRVGGGEPRGILQVDLRWEPAGERPLTVLGTHWDHRREDQQRLASARQLNELLDQWPDRPVILAGDLNTTPDTSTIAIVEQRWRRSNEEILPTIPVESPSRQIDYIFARPRGAWRTLECRVLEEKMASDHRPIFAILQFAGGP